MANTRLVLYPGDELAGDIEDAAEDRDMSTSKWLTEAARRQLQREQHEHV